MPWQPVAGMLAGTGGLSLPGLLLLEVILLLAGGLIPYLALDAFLRRVPLTGHTLEGPQGARQLWQGGAPYRWAGMAGSLAVLVPTMRLLWTWVGVWMVGAAAGGAALAGDGAVPDWMMMDWNAVWALAVGSGTVLAWAITWVLWRFGLRKQFPHLRRWL